jgi:triacylglycerol lipase
MCAIMAATVSAPMSASLDHWYELPAPDWEHLFYPQRGYHYFRQPLAPPVRSHVADQVTAAWMADAAMLAYGRSGPDLIPLDQFDSFFKNAGLTCHRIGEWSATAKGTQAFFAYNADFAVLSFRGTEKDDWTDSLVDLTILPVRETLDVPAPSAPNKTLFQLGLRNPVLNPSNSKEVGVHAGFQFALNAVWGQVQKNLEDYRGTNPEAPIFFTGHSLGAALATLAITRFNAANLVLFTYGCPRTGNTAFCDKVARKADLGIHRFVDNCDLVTRVPAKDLFYDHTSGMVHIDQNGNIAPGGAPDDPGELRAIAECLSVAAAAAKDFVSQAPPPGDLVDHSPTRYCYFVWQWARNGQVP